VIASVGVQSLLQCPRRQAQSLSAGRHLYRLEIQIDGLMA